MKRILLVLIRFYQRFISPAFPPRCRYCPTCSQYALEAVERFGPWRGGLLALRRFLRCHPFYKGDYYDPVPKTWPAPRRLRTPSPTEPDQPDQTR